jgi:hypothetical protein
VYIDGNMVMDAIQPKCYIDKNSSAPADRTFGREGLIMMHKATALVLATLVVGSWASPAWSAPETVTGRLVDLSCYSLNKEETGNAHRRGAARICAQACAREGFDVGLLTSAGKVYVVRGGLTADHNAKLVPHMGHDVTIAGDATEKNGVTELSASDLKMAAQ